MIPLALCPWRKVFKKRATATDLQAPVIKSAAYFFTLLLSLFKLSFYGPSSFDKNLLIQLVLEHITKT